MFFLFSSYSVPKSLVVLVYQLLLNQQSYMSIKFNQPNSKMHHTYYTTSLYSIDKMQAINQTKLLLHMLYKVIFSNMLYLGKCQFQEVGQKPQSTLHQQCSLHREKESITPALFWKRQRQVQKIIEQKRIKKETHKIVSNIDNIART